jgi:ureidoacrylate peracid hydrolase
MAKDEGLLTVLDDLVWPGHAALIIIDMQNDFCHKDGFFGRGGYDRTGRGQKPADLSQVEEMAPRLIRLIDAARSVGVEIYYVRSFEDDHYLPPMERLRQRRIGRSRILCPEGKWGSEQYAGFTPEPGDKVITKHVFSAFIGTDLEDILANAGIKSVIVTGVVTGVCCEATVRDGAMMGFYPIVPRDCVAAYSKEEHESSIARIESFWGIVTTSQEIIQSWQSDCRAEKPVSGSRNQIP